MASSPIGVRWRPPARATGLRHRRNASVTEPSASPGRNRCGICTPGTVPSPQGRRPPIRGGAVPAVRFPIKRLIGLGCRHAPGGRHRRHRPCAAGPRQRAEILAAATELIAAHGIKGMTMRQLAAAAGLNIATLYHYFGSKSELIGAIVDERHYDAGLRDLALPVDPTLAPRARLEAVFAQLVGAGAGRAAPVAPARRREPARRRGRAGRGPPAVRRPRGSGRALADRPVPRARLDPRRARPRRHDDRRHRAAARRVPRGDAARRRRPARARRPPGRGDRRRRLPRRLTGASRRAPRTALTTDHLTARTTPRSSTHTPGGPPPCAPRSATGSASSSRSSPSATAATSSPPCRKAGGLGVLGAVGVQPRGPRGRAEVARRARRATSPTASTSSSPRSTRAWASTT